jgi:hypothetical protein
VQQVQKEEFEPRLRAARERLTRLEAEAQALADAAARQAEVRLVIGKLQEFAEEIEEGLRQAEAGTRRDVIRALVKQIEVGDDDVRTVYRVSPVPFVERPEGGVLHDCRRRSEMIFLKSGSDGACADPHVSLLVRFHLGLFPVTTRGAARKPDFRLQACPAAVRSRKVPILLPGGVPWGCRPWSWWRRAWSASWTGRPPRRMRPRKI